MVVWDLVGDGGIARMIFIGHNYFWLGSFTVDYFKRVEFKRKKV